MVGHDDYSGCGECLHLGSAAGVCDPATCRRSVPVPVQACNETRQMACYQVAAITTIMASAITCTWPRWVRLPRRAVALTAALLGFKVPA